MMPVLRIFFSILTCFAALITVSLFIRIREPECTFLKIVCAIFAGLASLPFIIAAQAILPAAFPPVLAIFLINGVAEEGVKMLALFFLPYKKVSLRLFFSQAIIVGISVGSFEALVYLINGQQDILLRLITAVVLHGACTALAAFFVWNLRNNKKNFVPIAAAVIVHTAYNFFAGFTGILWWFSLACIGFALSLCAYFYERTQKEA